MNALLEAALGYARLGCPVFPLHSIVNGKCTCNRAKQCKPGKHPRTEHGHKDASTAESTIRAWWARWPDANIGVVTGDQSFAALDVDPQNGGDQSLEDLVAEHGALPKTPCVRTGSNGRHYYFKCPPGLRNSTSELAPGLDIRANGGYVVAPPSMHKTGRRYASEVAFGLHEVPLAEMPEWILRLLEKQTENAKTKPSRKGTVSSGELPPVGKRNDTLTKEVGKRFAAGESEQDVLRWALGWNRELEQPLPEAEVEDVVSNIAKAEARQQAEEKTKRTSKATKLVELALHKCELFRTPDGSTYADIIIAGHRETHSLTSKTFRRWLGRVFFEAEQAAPGGQAIQDALDVLEGHASYGPQVREVHVRVAGLHDRTFIDLGSDDWSAIEVDSEGWRIVAKPPVRFRRGPGMLPLPLPIPGGSIELLKAFLSDDGKEFILTVAWLLRALRGRKPYPPAVLQGEQGAGKSIRAEMLRRLVDPSTVPLRSTPKDERDLAVGANNAHLVAFDNLSRMEEWLADALCRLATGGGFGTRQLYTDSDETLFNGTRPILVNGIPDLVTRPDFGSRSIVFRLTLDPERRKTEEEFWAEFEKVRPAILGALLTALSGAIRKAPMIRVHPLPRMADFANFATAAESALGWRTGTFMNAYDLNKAEVVGMELDADDVASALLKLITIHKSWKGSATELLELLDRAAPDHTRRSRGWPTRACDLSGRLRRLAPALRAQGIEVKFARDNSSRWMEVTLKQPESSVTSVITTITVTPRCDATTTDRTEPPELVGDGEHAEVTPTRTGVTQPITPIAATAAGVSPCVLPVGDAGPLPGDAPVTPCVLGGGADGADDTPTHTVEQGGRGGETNDAIEVPEQKNVQTASPPSPASPAASRQEDT